MRTVLRPFAAAVALAAVTAAPVRADEAWYEGDWRVDIERSKKALAESEVGKKMPPEQLERALAEIPVLSKMVEMKLDGQFHWTQGEQTRSLPYELLESTKDSATLVIKPPEGAPGETTKIVVTRVDGGGISMRAAAETSKLDVIVWARVKKEPGAGGSEKKDDGGD